MWTGLLDLAFYYVFPGLPSLASLFLVILACEYENLESLLSMPFSDFSVRFLQEMLELGQK